MTTAEAETLVTAQSEGKLQLTLRNPLNAEKKIATVAPAAPAAPAAPVMAMATATETKRMVPRGNGEGGRSVTIIRGVEASVVNLH
ncbi:hypothetical protein D3C85_1621690 [compost metagenome]